MTNALLIAITAQFVPIETYRYGGFRPENLTGIRGYVDWSLSPFYIDALLDGEAFPSVSAQRLAIFNINGTALQANDTNDDSDLLYLPYVNISCLREMGVLPTYTNNDGQTLPRFYDVNNLAGVINVTQTFSRDSWVNFYTNETTRDDLQMLLFRLPDSNDAPDLSPVVDSTGPCFIPLSTQCRLVCTIVMHVTLSNRSKIVQVALLILSWSCDGCLFGATLLPYIVGIL